MLELEDHQIITGITYGNNIKTSLHVAIHDEKLKFHYVRLVTRTWSDHSEFEYYENLMVLMEIQDKKYYGI